MPLGSSQSEPSLTQTRPGRRPDGDQHHSSQGLYGAPSFSSLYVEPEDLEPGPGSYNIPQAFGYQHLSHHFSQPSCSLTAKHDKAWAKVMISKDHCESVKCRGTPGPGTYVPLMLKSQNRVKFGTSRRNALYNTSFSAPGPVYDLPESCEASLRAKVRFGKASRFDSENSSLSRSLSNTGPGQYEAKGTFEGNRLAKSFGASHRAYDKVRFPGSEKTGQGQASPGPGPNPHDGKLESRVGAFGRAERLPAGNEGKRAPGPGAYENHNQAPAHCRAMTTYSFGRPSAKGRVDWKQMRIMNCSLWGLQ